MRILIVNSWYYPNMKGGAEQSTKLLAEGLNQRGYVVAVLTGDGKNHILESEIINGIKVFRSCTHLRQSPKNIISKVSFKIKDLMNRKIKRDFLDVCNEFYPDIIHSNSMSGVSFYVWKLAKERNIPIVHTIRDYSLCSPRGIYETADLVKFPYKIFLMYYNYISAKYAKYISYVTAPSDFTLRLLHEVGFFSSIPGKCIVNAVTLNMEEVHSHIAERKRRIGHGKTVLFVGRLMKIKGIELLINAVQKIEDKDLRLLVCGEGECECAVNHAMQNDDRIIKCGQLVQSELEKKYLEADFVVVPSLWDEPFGRVVIEANKYGLPVLASNRGGIPEIIRETGGGVLFDACSEESFERTLREMIYNPDYTDFYESIEKNIEKYSIDYQIHNFELIYKSLLRNDRR